LSGGAHPQLEAPHPLAVSTDSSHSCAFVLVQVIADNEAGLLFKNKRDRKIINVDPQSRPGDNSTRTEVLTHEYQQVGALWLLRTLFKSTRRARRCYVRHVGRTTEV
jgi:hypothetical protein